MARKASVVEVNKFNAGLITDASPLTSPDNSSLDEKNMVLNIDGSRNRRLGLDFEENYNIITTTINGGSFRDLAIATYKWDNAGGDPEKSLQVVQVGNQIKIYDLDNNNISSNLIHTADFPSSDITDKFSYTVVDGILVVATGQKNIYSLTFTAPTTITSTASRLLIRDFFGVEDLVAGVDVTRGTEVQNRYAAITNNHIYNLRNQSFGVPRIINNTEVLADPAASFRTDTGVYPSNSDNVIEALYPDASDVDNRTQDRFFTLDLFNNSLGTSRAPQGYFIIDALDRSDSRIAEEAKNTARYTQLAGLTAAVINTDSTPSGATAVSEFAGRVFYAGFPGSLVGGDRHSPKMSSYVLFSKVVDNTADINLCYQEGDPTSKSSPDIIDTDGGFIRINEAYGIKKLINLGSGLMVVATNGVWRIYGGTDNGFTATSYIVEKITDRGCISQDSVVEIDNSFMFWGNDAIYHVTTDQYGGWVCNNISYSRIQNLFDSIPIGDKRLVKGEYDSYERKVRWLFYNRTTDQTPTQELVLDIQLQAYYLNSIDNFEASNFPKLSNVFITKPYQVTAGGQNYYRELCYLVVTRITPTVQYSFSTYRNTDFRDWYSLNGIGIDAEAFVDTSYLSGTDFQRDKRVPYITVHLRRTETGFTSIDGQLVPLNPSSCLVRAKWDWADSGNSGKWGREFQAYRYRRQYIPTDISDDFDNGFLTVVSRNKLRGNGKVLSLRFRTEPYKDLHLYGWSMIFSVAENV